MASHDYNFIHRMSGTRLKGIGVHGGGGGGGWIDKKLISPCIPCLP